MSVTILLAIITALMGWVGFSITAVLRGWMIPKATHELQVNILEKRLTEVVVEKDAWRQASLAADGVARETRSQHRLLLEQTQTTAYVMDQLRVAAQQARAERDGPT
jgi:hypothetical protein